METALYLAMALISVVLMLVVLMQSKGSGFSGTFSGGSTSIHRTRRGVEKTLFQFTIGLAALFIILSIVSNILI